MKFAAAFIAAVATASSCESDTQLIKEGEGFRSCMYVDTTGNRTVCYGLNLETSSAKSEVESVGGNYNNVYNGTECLSKSQCSSILNDSIATARSGEQDIYGNVSCYCAKEALVDMTYNLGEAGLAGFYTFNSYIESQQWDKAADDLYTTLWCSQVGTRCSRDAEQIRQCDNQAFLQ